MRYLPISEADRRAMLRSMGLERVEELFGSIPADIRLSRSLRIPGPYSEEELLDYFQGLATRNAHAAACSYFLGAGAYNHWVPAIIHSLVSRSEFYTSYTPYQPEISQGTLQAIFEFQTLICQLTGLEVANASLYDGSTALAEGVLMADRILDRRRTLVSATVHPEYREVLRTYLQNLDLEITELPYLRDGRADLESLRKAVGPDCAAVVVQSPNFFGVIEDVAAAAEIAHACGALLIVAVTEPLSLGLLRPPGALGADIVLGEGQSFGIPMGFGGPSLGFFASHDRYKRQMPGRMVGRAADADGQVGYVLTLATREQHIRREKATSNICTNEGLCALMAAIYLCTLGKQGLREVAELNLQKTSYAASLIARLPGYRVRFSGPYFNEFVMDCPADPVKINGRLAEEKIVGGLPLGQFYPELENGMVLCVTERCRKEEIDHLVHVLGKVDV
ncbi:MAG: aminomethyl-transferring glycine dehydrogenase subunit GcvPA [Acidobacteria bacterium]|nr:aminomethyl-transferring glycine dehydrogenase subunit GcvPA [Acidobacteriota bacterium]